MIIPGVSLHTDEETLNITTTLRNAEVKIDLFGANASTIKDNVIYIELYQTDESATTSVFLREIPVTVADLNYYIEISNLIPMTSYFIKLYGYIYNGTGYEKEQLYDIDYKSPNKNYYFSTLSKVGMTNVDVRYTAKSYTDKYLNVTYNLTTIVGYDRIDYDLYKYVTDENGTTTMVPVDINISSDVVFKNTMTKHIKFLPGSDITLDTDYHLVITPIAYVNINGVQQELILEDVASYDFYLSKLRSPFIGVVSTATDDLGLEFKISIIDVDKAIVNGTYTVKILDNLGNDVTPTEYQNVEYDITALNNIIRLSNLQRNTDYTLIVTTYVDRSNNAIDNERVDTKYTKRTLDDSGVDIGEVTSTMNSTNFAKIDLNFYSSYKLTYINELRYSIYNLNGYAEDNTVPFIPTQVENNNSIYYYQTLPYTLPSPGIYFIELQFLHDGRIIKQRTIQHYYTLN
jgi:hypothetical protein